MRGSSLQEVVAAKSQSQECVESHVVLRHCDGTSALSRPVPDTYRPKTLVHVLLVELDCWMPALEFSAIRHRSCQRAPEIAHVVRSGLEGLVPCAAIVCRGRGPDCCLI